MDKDIFVENVRSYCEAKGVKPTVACRESGVGTSFLPDVARGRTPSVGKVQMLAQYLGCTVSDLLGETSGQAAPALDPLTAEAARIFAALLPENRGKAIAFLLRLQRSEKR
jgi:transcriptional regulator with XRE-family HTH domain